VTVPAQPDVGITAFGGYVPPVRVRREDIAAAHAWASPASRSAPRGERSTCGWDEDTVTMAVDAARIGLHGVDRASVSRLYLGTTTAPYADRLNAGIVASALGLRDAVHAADVTGSQRAGTSALLSAVDAAAARGVPALCVASEQRRAAGATALEMSGGHAAASVLVGPGAGAARLLGSASLTVDFVDHYRAADREFDYGWEERWVRDAGWLQIVPRLVARLLDDCGLTAADVTRLCMPSPLARVDRVVAKACGVAESALPDQLSDGCGDSGAAHPLLLLVDALEQAQPGERILVVGFGQGGDALLFEVTDSIASARRGRPTVRDFLQRRRDCSYTRYATLAGLLTVDRGIRAEVDKATPHSAAWRHSDLLLALVGGRCSACGTHQLPRSHICANPDCRAMDTQEPHSFAESRGRVLTWSADNLTYTPDPPAYYGMVDFAEGGRLMMDFTDVVPGGVEVGTPMRMAFRIKDHDVVRGFSRYFWKAAPAQPQEA
jgi:3-hydroxy-3-methylglutaryl CoA synthase